ncbi:MAG: hypothetical protein ACREUF_04615, partial [Solimonas sp.]
MAVIATLRGVARAGATVSSGVGGKVAQLTADTTLASQTTDRATWQVAAGASLDLRVMAMQINGDSTADRIVARVYYETGTATLVRTIYDATPALAAGAAWQAVTTVSFFGTLDGTAGGTPCAGTLRLFIQVIRTGTAGGLSDFDVDSDGNVAVQGALVTSTESYVGVLRVNGQCITLAVGAYPAGSLFANGELIPLSATYIRPFA